MLKQSNRISQNSISPSSLEIDVDQPKLGNSRNKITTFKWFCENISSLMVGGD